VIDRRPIEHIIETPSRGRNRSKLTQMERQVLLRRLKHGPKLSREELAKWLMLISPETSRSVPQELSEHPER
jgi:hypothetical protein